MEVSFALKTAIELVQNGNKSSFEFIYKESFSFAWYRANLITGYNKDASADIVQDAYVICYQQINTLENVDAFYSWLASIIYHLGMKFFRKQKREYLVNDSEYEWDFYFPTNTDINNPELSSQEAATKDIIKELINSLPEIQKITLIAHYYDEMKIEQIAKIMDCPESTVKSRLKYARNSLRVAIEKTEKKYGYRIHSIAFPILHMAIKELLTEITINEGLEKSFYKEFLLHLQNADAITNITSHEKISAIKNDNLINHNYTASITSVLDSATQITASLGISAVLTAPLVNNIELEPIQGLDLFHIDFSSLIASLKTKFAIASAATAIGNQEAVLWNNIDLQNMDSYSIESIMTSSLSTHSSFYYDTCELSNTYTELDTILKK